MEATKPSLRDALRVLFKRKYQILLFFFATVVLGAAGTFIMEQTYLASTQILVKIGRENLYVPTRGSSNPVMSGNLLEHINSEIELLKNRQLAEQVIAELGPLEIFPDLAQQEGRQLGSIVGTSAKASLDEKALEKFQEAIVIERVKDSGVIQVGFKHSDPAIASRVVNTLARAYLDLHLKVHTSPNSYKFFKEQARLLKDKLAQAESELKDFKDRNNINSLNEERSLLLKQAADLNAAMNAAQSETVETKNRIRELKQQLAVTPQKIAQGEEVDPNHYLINTLQARLVELQIQEKELLTKYTEQSRFVQNVRDEIRLVRGKLAEQEKRGYGSQSYGLNRTYQALNEDLLKNEANLKALEGKQVAQRQQLVDQETKLGRLNQIEAEFNRLQHEVDMTRQNYSLYLSKYEEYRVSNAMDAEKITNVSIIEPAKAPLKPIKPKMLLNILLSIVVGLSGGFGLAYLLEYFDDTLESVEDVESCLQLPVLASIPEPTYS